MIFGKTTDKRQKDWEDKLKRKEKWFTLLPVEIKDGRIVWLQNVYKRRLVVYYVGDPKWEYTLI